MTSNIDLKTPIWENSGLTLNQKDSWIGWKFPHFQMWEKPGVESIRIWKKEITQLKLWVDGIRVYLEGKNIGDWQQQIFWEEKIIF